MADLAIKKELDNDTLTITLAGHLNKISTPMLDQEIDGALDGIAHLILDLKALDYISSAGLRTLLTMELTMEKQGDMKILNVNTTVMDTFRVTGFSSILNIENP